MPSVRLTEWTRVAEKEAAVRLTTGLGLRCALVTTMHAKKHSKTQGRSQKAKRMREHKATKYCQIGFRVHIASGN